MTRHNSMTRINRTNRATRATTGKLGRALVELESFENSDNVAQMITYREQLELAKAIDVVRAIEYGLLDNYWDASDEGENATTAN